MSKTKNYMMDVEEFCDGYFYGDMSDETSVPNDFTIDEVVEDVGMYFKTNLAKDYARQYLTTQMGEM